MRLAGCVALFSLLLYISPRLSLYLSISLIFPLFLSLSLSFFLSFYFYLSLSLCLYLFVLDGCRRRNFCSFCAFRSTFVFVSSGTDCRVRRRMHAPFPGPYVSTILPLILNPPPSHCTFCVSRLVYLFSLSLSLFLFLCLSSNFPFCFSSYVTLGQRSPKSLTRFILLHVLDIDFDRQIISDYFLGTSSNRSISGKFRFSTFISKTFTARNFLLRHQPFLKHSFRSDLHSRSCFSQFSQSSPRRCTISINAEINHDKFVRQRIIKLSKLSWTV